MREREKIEISADRRINALFRDNEALHEHESSVSDPFMDRQWNKIRTNEEIISLALSPLGVCERRRDWLERFRVSREKRYVRNDL